MSNQAKVTSTEALESFRAHLIVFATKAKLALDASGEEVRRTRQWLQHDQRSHFEGEHRRKTKQLEQAQQELMSIRLGADAHQQSALMSRQMAVAKAQRELAEIEGKLRKLKAWAQNFDASSEPVVKRMEHLRQSLNQMPKAVAYLVGIQRALNAYTESGGPVAGVPTELAVPAEPTSESLPESAPGVAEQG
jgi:chromosome segregation ATPase